MSVESLIMLLGNWISFAGVGIVILGVFVTLAKLLVYFANGFDEERAARLRHSLMIYLSLGLDFLIAKDVIITLSLEGGDIQDFYQLGAVVLIRVMLSLFVHLEDKELHMAAHRGGKAAKKSSKKKSLKARLLA